MTERVRNQKVDILRGIAAVLMILGHSFIVYPVNIASVPWCAAIEHFIYTFHMELFFILAGYVYHCIGYKNYIRKKIERIALPYFVFGIGAMLLRAYGGSAINGTESIGEGIIKLLFRGGGYWFLYVLFLIFAIYPLIEKVLVNIKTEIATAILILIATQFIHFPAFFCNWDGDTLFAVLYGWSWSCKSKYGGGKTNSENNCWRTFIVSLHFA